MMKLILSLTLFWTLSSTAEAVECWLGEGVDTSRNFLFPCDTSQLCATIGLQENVTGILQQTTLRLCLPTALFSEGKFTYSYNIGVSDVAASLLLCNTDQCNGQPIAYPGAQPKNNLQCFTCDDRSSTTCTSKVQCAGTEDRCVSGTAEDNEGSFPVYGCATAKLCEIAARLDLLPVPVPIDFPRPPNCCGSNLCNKRGLSKNKGKLTN
ncbi:uncharacterized protein LOC128361413 [Scomber japonicus]|uniref:uncharacterized protein LOC128361413 n=1 Tax=Scomber japonicus TaxID=13676 RepID=UPI002306D654|nr:uncharacterized protein LOC128361413 [Scomber japonicus]